MATGNGATDATVVAVVVAADIGAAAGVVAAAATGEAVLDEAVLLGVAEPGVAAAIAVFRRSVGTTPTDVETDEAPAGILTATGADAA